MTEEQKAAWWQALADLREGKLTEAEFVARHAEFGIDETRARAALQRK